MKRLSEDTEKIEQLMEQLEETDPQQKTDWEAAIAGKAEETLTKIHLEKLEGKRKEIQQIILVQAATRSSTEVTKAIYSIIREALNETGKD